MDRLIPGLANVEKWNPDIAEFRLLIPDIDDIERRPKPAGLEQANPLTNARYDGKAQLFLALIRLVLNFDLDHYSGPQVIPGSLTANR